MCRSVVLGATAIALLALGSTAHAITINKCQAGKIKCVSGHFSAIMKCHNKAEGKGLAVDPICVSKGDTKYTGGTAPLKGCFAKLEAKGGCTTTGDSGTWFTENHDTILELVQAIDPGYPTVVLNKCSAGKKKCVDGLGKALFKCYNKAAGTGSLDPVCIQKAQTKYTGGTAPAKGCIAKLEAKYPPASLTPCLTYGDAGPLANEMDSHVAEAVCALNPDPTSCPSVHCPTEIQFTGTSTNGILDTGWTGQGHDATVISKGTVTVAVTECDGSVLHPNTCGDCDYAGPIPNHAGQLKVQRCLGDSSIQCTTDGDCGGNAPCKFFFGSNLPLAAGGVATCVQNVFAGGISGTADLTSGDSAGSANVTSRVFTAGDIAHPCPNCDGDAVANDGIAGGTCTSGPRAALACDASGSSPNIQFGTTSLDCPPGAGALAASLPIDLSNTTASKTKTITAANPLCRSGPAGSHCQCDTCNTAGVVPCSSNADCPDPAGPIGPFCGGKRCLAGGNGGAACTANSECPGSACGVPGQATEPNACDDDVCSPDPNTPGPNDKACLGGPFDTFCSPVETFRGCLADSDCPFAGDTCSGGKNRDCFDNGNIGDVVTATGQADPPSGHASDPTLAALFCIGHTGAPAVNGAAGLPGLGRLELQGHSTDNGTP